MDAVVSWITFLVVLIAAGRIGLLFPRIGFPLITGFLFTGVLAGPFVLGIIQKTDLKPLGLTNQAALAYIAFSAGAELYLPELRSAFKAILWQTAGITISVMLFVTILITGLSNVGLSPWPLQENTCSISVALVAAAICVTSSPAASIAILKELKAKGAFCSTLLGITVLCDVVVLLMFSFTTTIAESNCKGGGFSIASLAIMIAIVIASICIGWVVGKILIVLVMFKRLPTRYLILPFGLAIFWVCHWFTEWTHEHLEYVLNFEPLLMCITAGFVCTNQSKHRHRFISVLQQAGPYIFLPFFTLTGASLDLTVLGQSLIFAVIVCAIRAVSLFMGAGVGGVIAKQSPRHNLLMWMSQITQAGVSLGLASEVGMAFPTFGRAFQTAIIAVVLVNQVLGPIFFKVAVRGAGEAGKAAVDDEMDEDRTVPTALVVGYTPQTMGIALKLLNEKWNVVMIAGNDAEAEAALKDLKEYGLASRVATHAAENGLQKAQKAISEQVREIQSGIKKMQDKVEDMAVKAVAGAEGSHAHHDPHHKIWIVEDGFKCVGLLHGSAEVDYGDLKPVTGREEEAAHEDEGGNTDHASLATAGAEWNVDVSTITAEAQAAGSGAAAAAAPVDGTAALPAAAADPAGALSPVGTKKDIQPNPATDYRLANLVQQVGSIPSLAAVVIDLPCDSASFAAVEAVHDRIARAPRRSHLHGVRVVALVRATEWVEPFYRMGAVPIHAGAALVTAMAKVSTAPLARPIPLLSTPAYNLDELGKAAAKMTEGQHVWKYLPSGFGAEDNAFMTMKEHKESISVPGTAGVDRSGSSGNIGSLPSFRRRQGGLTTAASHAHLPPSTEAINRAVSLRHSQSFMLGNRTRANVPAAPGIDAAAEAIDKQKSGKHTVSADAIEIAVQDPAAVSSSGSSGEAAPTASQQARGSPAAVLRAQSVASLPSTASFSVGAAVGKSQASTGAKGVKGAVAAVAHTMQDVRGMMQDEVSKLVGEIVPDWQKDQYLANVEQTSGFGMTHARPERRGSSAGKGFSGILNTLVSGGTSGGMTDFTGAGGLASLESGADSSPIPNAGATAGAGTAKGNASSLWPWGAARPQEDDDQGTGVPTGMDAVTYFANLHGGKKRLNKIQEVEYLGEFTSPFDTAPEAEQQEQGAGGLASQDAAAQQKQQSSLWH